MSSASSLPGYLSNVLKLILILKGDEEFANLHAVTFHLQPDTNESSSHPANDSVNAPSPLPPLPSSSTSLTDLPILSFSNHSSCHSYSHRRYSCPAWFL